MVTISDFTNKEKIKKLTDKVEKLTERNKKLVIKHDKVYSLNYSARKEVETLKRHKQSVLKAVITLILDGLLVMTDDELEERYFVDIGNIRQTRNTIKRERK